MQVTSEWLIGAFRNLQHEAEENQTGHGIGGEEIIVSQALNVIAKAVAAGFLDASYGAAITGPKETVLQRVSRVLCKQHPYPNLTTALIARDLNKKAFRTMSDADCRDAARACEKAYWQCHAWIFGKLAELIAGDSTGEEQGRGTATPSRRRKTPRSRGPLKLTPREKRAGELLASGHSQKQIAADLKVTGGRVSQLLEQFRIKTGAMVRVERTRQSVHAHKMPEGRNGEALL